MYAEDARLYFPTQRNTVRTAESENDYGNKWEGLGALKSLCGVFTVE